MAGMARFHSWPLTWIGPARPARGMRIMRFGTAQRPFRADERRRLARLARAVVAVAQAADVLVNRLPPGQIGAARGRLVHGQLVLRAVGRVNLRAEPAAAAGRNRPCPRRAQEQQDRGARPERARCPPGARRLPGPSARVVCGSGLIWRRRSPGGGVRGRHGRRIGGGGRCGRAGSVMGAMKSGASARRLTR